jgi:hypothetical protein
MHGNFELQVKQRAVINVCFTQIGHRFDTDYFLFFFNYVFFLSSGSTTSI